MRVDSETVKDSVIGSHADFTVDESKYEDVKYIYKETKYFSREKDETSAAGNYTDTELTGDDKDIVLEDDKLVIKVYYQQNFENNEELYFFVIKDFMHKPDGWEQDSKYYMPEGGNQTGKIWGGTANSIEDLILNEDDLSKYGDWDVYDRNKEGDIYFSIYDTLHGIDDISGFSFNEGVEAKIDARVAEYVRTNCPDTFKKYTQDAFSEDDVLWYVYKRQNAGPPHIDGYITTYITYHANYVGASPESVTGEKVRINETATVIDNMFVRPGYTFAGWYTDSACTDAFDFATADKINKYFDIKFH